MSAVKYCTAVRDKGKAKVPRGICQPAPRFAIHATSGCNPMSESEAAMAMAQFRRLGALKTDNDGVQTVSSQDQEDCENDCAMLLARPAGRDVLRRKMHVAYLLHGLQRLPAGFVSLDASRPWIIYWILHGLSLLKARPKDMFDRCVDTLSRCQTPGEWAGHIGGFAGGPQQLPHLAPTYAAVLALCTIGTPTALAVPDRKRMYRFFMSLKRPDGSFHLHLGGEVDIRGSYTLLCVAKLLNILTPELASGAAEWIASCLTLEGSFGGEPGSEAHGGYAFNGLAALTILERFDLVDTMELTRWLCARQMRLEGGFQGRANKLVDGCYSFWQGAVPALLQYHDVQKRRRAAGASKEAGADTAGLVYDAMALQRYILICCQGDRGGLRDKPGKRPDYYHTCYCLSGLSVAQHYGRSLLGPVENLLERTNPVFNIRDDLCEAALAYYAKLPSTHAELMKNDKEQK